MAGNTSDWTREDVDRLYPNMPQVAASVWENIQKARPMNPKFRIKHDGDLEIVTGASFEVINMANEETVGGNVTHEAAVRQQGIHFARLGNPGDRMEFTVTCSRCHNGLTEDEIVAPDIHPTDGIPVCDECASENP